MSTDAGSGFDNQAAGLDAGDERLADEESRHLLGEDVGDSVAEEDDERAEARDRLNEAF